MVVRAFCAIAKLYHDAFAGLPRLTWLLCLAGFLNRCGAMVVPFLGLYVKDRFGHGPAEAGVLISIYGLGAFVGSWLGGWLTDRLGAVRTQVATLSATAVWMAAMPWIGEPMLFAATVFVLGVLNDAFRPGSISAVAVSCAPELRRKALALNRLMLNLGWAFGPTIGGYLVAIDFRLMFWVDGGTCLIAAVFLAIALRRWHPVVPPRERGDALRPYRDRHFLWLMAANVIVLIAFMQYFTTGTRVFEDNGHGKHQIGWFLAVNPIMITLFEMPVVHLLRGHRALPIIATGALVVGLGYACLLLPFEVGSIVLGMIVVAGGELLQMPMLGAYVNDHAQPSARGAYNGAYGMSFCLALFLAPLLGGFAYAEAGEATLWCACAVLGAVSALAFFVAKPPAPR